MFHIHLIVLLLKQYIHWSSWWTQKRCMTWRASLRPVQHMTIFSFILQKRTESFQLTIALYYLPIVLSITRKYKSSFLLPDWKMLQNFVCGTGHSLTESPFCGFYTTVACEGRIAALGLHTYLSTKFSKGK